MPDYGPSILQAAWPHWSKYKGPALLIPQSIYHEPIGEPSVETTTDELRALIGDICANRLRFDAEGKFREV